MHEALGADCFKALFPAILGDNGSEFSNPKALELDAPGNRRTRVFYCDPNAPFRKPNVELNHEFIRRVLPKGTSFDNLVQDVRPYISYESRRKAASGVNPNEAGTDIRPNNFLT
jgi:IS30 family transposase